MNETRFDRGAWLTLFFVAVLLLISLFLLFYRLTLPTDGWISTEPDGFDTYGFIYTQDVMGASSGLQVGDHLVAVDGISLDKPALDFSLFSLRPVWLVGNMVNYTVVRDGEVMEIAVSLVNWQWPRFFGRFLALDIIFTLLSMVIFLMTGFIAFLKRPEIPAARALLVLGASLISVMLGTDPLPGMVNDYIFPLSVLPLSILIMTAFTVLIPPAFIRFGLVFPRPKPILERLPWVVYLPYLIGIIGIVAFLNGFFVFGWVWTAVSIAITIPLLIHSAFTMRDAVSRAQLRWGLGGMLLGMVIFLSSWLPIFVKLSEPVTDFIDSWSVLGIGAMSVTLAIAILRYRLFDIDVIIRRTLVYSLLTILLGAIYLISVGALQQVFRALTGADSKAAVVVSTLGIAGLFNPLRRRIQGVIDRRFYRSRYDAENIISEFSRTVSDQVDIDQLSRYLLKVSQETMQPESISLWVSGADKRSTK